MMKFSNRLLGVLFIFLALSVLWAASQLPDGAMGDPGSAVYPMAIALLMLPLGLILAMQKAVAVGHKNTGEVARVHRQGLFRGAALLVLTGLFIGSLEYLGVLAATVCFLWLAAILLGRRTLPAIASYFMAALLIGGGAYLVFVKLLHLTLPSGMFL